VVDAAMRQRMGEAAVRLARAGGYTNAGTLEFMVDEQKHFYFLEMNTRLQVEHPVTEMVTGLDLVKLQIRIAAGEALPFQQDDVTIRGHAIECRVYAEDPDNNFFPSPGKILARRIPAGPGIRMDDGVYPGWVVPNDYDPLLGKLIAWGGNREEAIERMKRALDEYYVSGIKTNIGLFRRIMAEADFSRAKLHTRWLDELLQAKPMKPAAATEVPSAEDAAVLAAVLYHVSSNGGEAGAEKAPTAESRWKISGREELVNREPKK
ncbi:MAG: acetyl-CoA carboxylase biotin carboxylase subunit, partial [Acidobacteria bacterium]|nr:acetyl-CoA carboxylase biotin carboxylase subunit [Acidobacteriota bacterium]